MTTHIHPNGDLHRFAADNSRSESHLIQQAPWSARCSSLAGWTRVAFVGGLFLLALSFLPVVSWGDDSAQDSEDSSRYKRLSITVAELDRRTADQLIARHLPRGSSLPNHVTLTIAPKVIHYDDWLENVAGSPSSTLFETRQCIASPDQPIELAVGGNYLLPPEHGPNSPDNIPQLRPAFIGWKTKILPYFSATPEDTPSTRFKLTGTIRTLRPVQDSDRSTLEWDIRFAADIQEEEFLVVSHRISDGAILLILRSEWQSGPIPPELSNGEQRSFHFPFGLPRPKAEDSESDEQEQELLENETEGKTSAGTTAGKRGGEAEPSRESRLRQALQNLRDVLDELLDEELGTESDLESQD